MNKKLKKMLAAVSAVAVCAVSMTAMASGAIYINNPGVTPYTVSFSLDDVKYTAWQEMTDYFDNPEYKFFISENGKGSVFLFEGDIYLWHFNGYNFKNDEDLAVFKGYLADNNIEYKESSFPYQESYDEQTSTFKWADGTNIQLVGYKFDECFQLSKKIKEDTGFKQSYAIPLNGGYVNVTSVENALPEVTLAGDANEDGEVNISDAVLIMQAIANPEEFELTWQGIANADVYGDGDGVTLMDALTIQEMSLNKSNA